MKLKNVLLSLIGLGFFMSSFFVVAAPVICGSVSMTASGTSTGSITCEGSGGGNLEIKNDQIDIDGTEFITMAGAGAKVTTLAELGGAGGTDGPISILVSSGEFTVDGSIWNTWKSIYVGIKQGNGHSDGGWGLFLLSSVVDGGNYATKISGNGGTGISHAFVVGGERLSEVPLPAAVWLFGPAFAGLIGFAKKRIKVA